MSLKEKLQELKRKQVAQKIAQEQIERGLPKRRSEFRAFCLRVHHFTEGKIKPVLDEANAHWAGGEAEYSMSLEKELSSEETTYWDNLYDGEMIAVYEGMIPVFRYQLEWGLWSGHRSEGGEIIRIDIYSTVKDMGLVAEVSGGGGRIKLQDRHFRQKLEADVFELISSRGTKWSHHEDRFR